jgi:hypothetical protein
MSEQPPARPPRLVRPYVLTKGRTRAPGAPLALEASIHAVVTPMTLATDATPESRRIVELCQAPMSLAELAARLLLPVGVVRILVADLATAQHVTVGEPTPRDAATDVTLLERLLDGIRAL